MLQNTDRQKKRAVGERLMASRTIKELTGCHPETVGEAVVSVAEPVVIRNLVAEWPAVIAGKRSAQDVADYIQMFYSGEKLTAFTGPPEIKGRVGYNDDLTAFNFDRISTTLDKVLDPIFARYR